jgi:hypothetical protein
MPNFRDFLREFGIFAVMLRRLELERIKGYYAFDTPDLRFAAFPFLIGP